MTIVVVKDDEIDAFGEYVCGFVVLVLSRCLIFAIPGYVLLGIGLKDHLSPPIKNHPCCFWEGP